MSIRFVVIVKMDGGGWVWYSSHIHRYEAHESADMVHGRVVRLDAAGMPIQHAEKCPACDGNPVLCECVTPWSR